MSTFEERVAALIAANSPRQPLKADPLSGRTTRRRSSAVSEPAPVRATAPKQPATPKAQYKSKFTEQLLEESRPWSEQPKSDVFWAGMSEPEWDSRSTSLHRWIGTNPNASQLEIENQIGRHFPNLLDGNHEDDISEFVKRARSSRGRGLSTFQEMGVPHAGTSEGTMVRNLRKGNRESRLLNSGRDVKATDLTIDNVPWDVQNWTNRDGRMGISVLEGLDDIPQAQQILRRAEQGNWTLDQAVQEVQQNMGSRGGKLLHDFGEADPYHKGGLIGTVYEQGKVTNLLTQNGVPAPQKGTFDPTFGQGEFALDFNELRYNTLDQPIRETLGKDGRGLRLHGKSGNLKLHMPFGETRNKSGGKGLIKRILGKDVIDSIGEAAYIRGERPTRTYGSQYHAGLPVPDPVKTAKGAVRNWKGGLGNTVLSGASRETGKALGRGDVKGAATSFATEYATGAIAEAGLRGAAKSKVGQRIATAVGKRAAPALARWGAGTGGSGGLLAPVMTAITAVDLADGVVEGVTGKGTIDHAADNVRDTYTRTTGDERTDAEITSNLTGPKTPYQLEKVGGTQLRASAAEKASAFLEKSTGVKATPAPAASITPGPGPSTDTVSVPQKENWIQSLDRGMTWLRKKAGF